VHPHLSTCFLSCLGFFSSFFPKFFVKIYLIGFFPRKIFSQLTFWLCFADFISAVSKFALIETGIEFVCFCF